MIGDETRSRFLADVGMRVRVARVARRLSQSELAAQVSMSRVTLGSVERGSRDAALTTYRSLAMALEVPLSVLVDEDDSLVRVVAASTRSGSSPAREAEQSEGLPS